MWYNIIPPFMPLNLNLYPVYPTETKGLDLLIIRNYVGYVHGYVYPILEQSMVSRTFTQHIVGNRTMVQPVTNMDIRHVQ